MPAPANNPSQSADALEILDKLDWFEAKNKEQASEYYRVVNPSCAIAMGQSCGGLQAIIMSTSGDERVRTTVALNTGTFADQVFVVEKAALDRLGGPIVYIIGGESDITYPQATDDFKKIDRTAVPSPTWHSCGSNGRSAAAATARRSSVTARFPRSSLAGPSIQRISPGIR